MNSAVARNLFIGIIIAAVLGGGLYWYLRSSASSSPYQAAGAPSLDVPFVITADLPEDMKTLLTEDAQKLTNELRENPGDFLTWLQLAVDYKIAGDYEHTIRIWEYVIVSGPTSLQYVAYGNLGDLYMNFLKDYPKAEQNYQQALALKPDEVGYYADMYRLYHYLYKTGTGADAAILEQGLAANPGNKDLLALKEQLSSGK